MSEDTLESEEVEEVEETSLSQALSAAYDKAEKVEEPVKEATVETQEPEKVVEVSPPEHWSDEDKEAFMRMDDSGREWALRLEKNASKGIQEKSEELKKFRSVIEPYKYLFQGVDESQAIKNLLNAQAYLSKDPVEGIKWLMKSYGVDEKQFSADETQEYVDPEIKALKDQIKQLQSQSESSIREAEQRRQQAMLAEIAQFRDAEADGKPLHPYFNAVQSVMAGLMQSGRATSLQDAYQQAVWSHPEYRDSEVDRKAKELAEQQLAARIKASEDAKKKVSVQGKKSSKKATGEVTLKSALEEAYDKSVRGEL